MSKLNEFLIYKEHDLLANSTFGTVDRSKAHYNHPILCIIEFDFNNLKEYFQYFESVLIKFSFHFIRNYSK